MTTLLIIIIILAFIFDYINGFHDAANSIATIVSTKVLKPFQAVIWAAFFNFAAFFISKYWIGEFKIGNTIAKSVSIEVGDVMALYIVLAGLIAAITWNLLTWYLGIPSSSSHTLIGGFIGAAVARYGTFSVIVSDKVLPIILFIFLAPIIGMFISSFFTLLILNICKNGKIHKIEKWFKRIQLISSAAFSLGHGGNDAQKVMGIIGAAMLSSHYIPDLKSIPDWVPISCFVAIGLGTLSGGWRIVKTMGGKITKVTPLEGVSAESAGACTLYIAEHLGIPVSTTHTITGAIIGVGAVKRTSAVRWGVTISLLWAWILTIPVSALMGAVMYYIFSFFVV